MRPTLVLAFILLSFKSFSATPMTRTWELEADFIGGKAYAIEFNPLPGGLVSLRPDLRFNYAKDPVEAAAGSTWFWTKNSAAIKRTFSPIDTGLVVSEPALVSVGEYIYLIGGCVGGGAAQVTQSRVWFCRVIDGVMQDWQMGSWDYGRTINDIEGIPIGQTRAVSVGNRIYVAGGSTANCGIVPFIGGEQATSAVFSAPVDPVTHDVGPWVKEPSLLRTVVNHGFVYAAGALYTIGGRERKLTPTNSTTGEWAPHQWVQKAEIKPDGHLSSWEAIRQVPIGVPPYAGGSNPYCECSPISWCDSTDLECCRSANLTLGWEQIGGFSVGRTLGFIGGAYTPPPILSSPCRYFTHGFYAYLDDNNRIIEWTGMSGTKGRGRAGCSAQIYNGSFISMGGETGGTVPDVMHNSAGQGSGMARDTSFGYDSTEIRPDYLRLDIEDATSPRRLPVDGNPMPSVMVKNCIFVMGFRVGGVVPTADVYRTTLAPSTNYVDAAYFISEPCDLGASYRLKNVAWSFKKSGTGTAVNPDDWAMVRYRLADENMNWSSWTPRIPEASNMPLVPGDYTYSYLQPDGTVTPRSSPLWMAVNSSTFRYIQFEVNLYKDSGTANRAEFGKFEIQYEVPPLEYDLSDLIEAFPVPATTDVTFQFKVIPEGAEVKVRLFNVAGEPVAERNFVYSSGGNKSVTLPVSGIANGAYIAVIQADSIKDNGGGLLDGTERRTKGRIKVVVRHKK